MATAAPPLPARVYSVDLIRGAVMVLMAIDHVRVYSGLPAGGPTAGIFFTRWITNFCAPAFVFLAGTSAFFYRRKHYEYTQFLIQRGVWLILLELTALRVAWTFNTDFAHYNMAGVIWMIGWCMILLAGLARLPLRAMTAVGLTIIVAHNLLDSQITDPSLGEGLPGALWRILYVGFWAGPIKLGADGPSLTVLYSIIPWIGVMVLGYAFGEVLRNPVAERDRLCLRIGLGATALFLVLRAINHYGDPRPWHVGSVGTDGAPAMPTILGFLNTTKYPASLDFLLMTLGPTIALIPLLEKTSGRFTQAIATFGRVPFFFYVLHIPLIHALALIVSRIREGAVNPWLFANHPMGNPPAPAGYAWSLPLLYLIWAIAVALLYYPCRGFTWLKENRGQWWLKYL